MSNSVQMFENLEIGAKIRTIMDEAGEPLFVAKDIADALGYSDAQAMTRRLDEDEKVLQSWTDELSVQPRHTSFITESGNDRVAKWKFFFLHMKSFQWCIYLLTCAISASIISRSWHVLVEQKMIPC